MLRGILKTSARNFHMSSTPHIVVAGLGNAPYPSTRHSVGQYIVTALSTHLNIPLSSSRLGHTGTGTAYLPSGPVELTLFKSKSLMNVSGPSIASVFRAAQVPPEQLVLVYDSLTHAPCRLGARLGGSAQGHNGVKSVMHSLQATATNKMFWQFRVGVGRGNPAPSVDGEELRKGGKKAFDKSVDAAQWVLGPLSLEEKEYWGVGGKGLESVLREIDRVAKGLRKDP